MALPQLLLPRPGGGRAAGRPARAQRAPQPGGRGRGEPRPRRPLSARGRQHAPPALGRGAGRGRDALGLPVRVRPGHLPDELGRDERGAEHLHADGRAGQRAAALRQRGPCRAEVVRGGGRARRPPGHAAIRVQPNHLALHQHGVGADDPPGLRLRRLQRGQRRPHQAHRVQLQGGR
ncbi:hypothetical protein ONE63_008415 [Megalurothrips usitatus]|uniref:Uncharacterized protein n=1 Tax=Megalurothrips usitatus TaxID=439358 RepID=A0AAV7XM43_9NEOP|nr:hypothetical protein ONE63_008415 [Megalurothrips usitatus]